MTFLHTEAPTRIISTQDPSPRLRCLHFKEGKLRHRRTIPALNCKSLFPQGLTPASCSPWACGVQPKYREPEAGMGWRGCPLCLARSPGRAQCRELSQSRLVLPPGGSSHEAWPAPSFIQALGLLCEVGGGRGLRRKWVPEEIQEVGPGRRDWSGPGLGEPTALCVSSISRLALQVPG